MTGRLDATIAYVTGASSGIGEAIASEGMAARFSDVELLHAKDVADAITYVVTRPSRVAINEVLIRPTEQVG